MWSRVVAISLVLVMVLSAFLILGTPARASLPSIGLPRGLPDYMKYITINNLKFDPLVQMPDIPASLRYDTVPRNQPFYYIVQFNGPVTPLMKGMLAATGVTILQYIAYNAFIVRGDGLAMDRVAALPVIRWTGVFEPAYKLSPHLSDDFAALAERLMERERNGDSLDSGAVTVLGPGLVPAKSINGAGGAPSSAASFGPRASTSGGLTSAGPQTSFGAAPASGSSASPTTTRISLEITAFERSAVPEIVRVASILGGKQISYNFGQTGNVRVEVDKGALALFARVPGVMFIDRFVQPYIANDLARWVVQSGDTDTFATPVHDHGIHGTNQTVTLGDTGIDYKHPDFWDPGNTTPGPNARKLTAYYEGCSNNCDMTDNGINHGTHTSGSVAGDDGQWHVYNGDATGSNGTTGPHDGQAFDAWINMQDLSNDGFGVYFDSITDLWQMAVNHTSWIHSDSWGSCCATYIQEAADTDNFIWNNQDFLVVFAAGNSGQFGLGTINPFSVAKNVIAAGATVNGLGLENVADFSSRGPTADGRIKPDIMAPGVALWSAQGLDPGGDGTQYWQLSGTSMATPTIAGSSALVRQYYMDGWYPTGAANPSDGFTPSAALIKATDINSAREMTGTGAYGFGETWYPNDNQGFGRLTLDDALFFAGDARGLSVDDHRSGLNTGDSVSYSLAIGDASLPVEITLVWSDYPGVANCGVCLVNDLDLTVTAPDGTVYAGNQYMGYNPGESQPNPSGSDHVNNVESVLVISNVQTGVWTVNVGATDIPNGPQTYAIVMTGGIATEHGVIQMDHNSYQSSATVNVKVVDTGLNVDPNAPDTVDVNMSSTTETTPEVLTLTETGNDTSVFAGSIPLQLGAANPNDGILQVQNGDTITAMYYDNNDGQGGAGPTYDYAVVDDSPPVISGIGISNLRFNRANVDWTTDEPSDSVVHWDTSTPPGNTNSDSHRTLSHSIPLAGLTDNTTYFFSVQSTDEAGNTALDDNNSAYYTFTTPTKPPTALPDSEWPTFHNNEPRQGISPSNFLPPINQQWTDGPFLINRWNGPVMKDGILFSAPLDGTLRARDPYTGEVLWSRALGGQYYYTSTMSAANGVLYATFYSGAGGYVYALDEITGDTIWSVGFSDTSLDFNARNNMLYADDLVFGTTWGSQAYALNAADGTVAWTFQMDSLAIASGASVNAGLAYFATIGGTVYALDEFSGSLVWSATLDNTITTTPLYAQGNIYVGTYSGTEYALDALTGATTWSTGGFYLIDASAAVYDGVNIYFGTFNAQYVALDATDGHQVWSTGVSGPVGTAPAYANGFLYGTCWYCPLYTFDTSDGSIVDQDGLSSGSGSTSFPAISDGWVWVEDNDGNIYGFLGQLPVGLLLKPAAQSQDSTPDNVVSYGVNVKNIGISGPDTFDATITLGPHQWAVALYESDGTTPLPDTDGDGIPDTGSLATGASTDIVIKVTVPASVNRGDSERSLVTFTSSNDLTRFKVEKLTTIVPVPDVSIGPRAYFPLQPGDTAVAPMNATNKGGFPDTIELSGTSAHGWTVTFYAADGVTPLQDTDQDGLVDTGQVPGLSTTPIVVTIQVPSNAPLDLVDRTDLVATSHYDPTKSSTSSVVIELTPPPSVEWPQFHHDRERGGVNPDPFQNPLTQRWVTSVSGSPIRWTGSVIDGHTVFVSSPSGKLTALDIGTGAILWQKSFGQSGLISGTPAVSLGVVYVTFVTNSYSAITLFAIDEATGNQLWRVDSNIGFAFTAFSTVAVAAGNVYWDDVYGYHLFANDAATGAPVWTYNLPGAAFQGPTYWGGTVYASDLNGDIIALDAFTGDLLWQTNVGNLVTGAPTVSGGVVYAGDYSGILHAIDALTGDRIWDSQSLGALIDVSSPVVAEGKVFEGSFANDYFSGYMSALDVNTGNIVWQSFISAGAVGTSPAYNNGTVFMSTWDGNLWSWDAATGDVIQTLALSDLGSTSSVALGDGYAIVGDEDGEITGFSFVGAGEVNQISVAPATAQISVGSASIFEASAVDLYDNHVGGVRFAWDSLRDLGTILPVSDNTIVYIAGFFAGTDTIDASANGHTGAATVDVLPGPLYRIDVAMLVAGNRIDGAVSIAAGEQGTFVADSTDRFGNEITGATLTWGVTGGVGTINSAGVFTASTTLGVGFVTATHGSGTSAVTGRQQVTIVPAAPATVDITATSTSVSVDSQSVIVATVRDQYGNANTDGEVLWSTTSTGSILSLTPDGRSMLYHAPITTTPASVQVTATIGSVSRTITLTLVAGPPVGITIDAPATTVAVGGTLSFGAVVTDQFGNAVTGATIAWETTAGSINQQGVFTAPQNPGLVVISASTAGRSSFVVVEVTSSGFEQFSRQATSTTSLVLLLVAIVAIVASVFLFVRGREARRELEEIRRGRGGPGGEV